MKAKNEKNQKNDKIKDKTKLPKYYFKKIISLATNKSTNEMSGHKIAGEINRKLEERNVLNKKGKLLSIKELK